MGTPCTPLAPPICLWAWFGCFVGVLSRERHGRRFQVCAPRGKEKYQTRRLSSQLHNLIVEDTRSPLPVLSTVIQARSTDKSRLR